MNFVNISAGISPALSVTGFVLCATVSVLIWADVSLARTRRTTRRIETAQVQKSDVRSERFAREIEELARKFARRLQETRELRPDVEKLFTGRFTDCHLKAEVEGKENAIFRQISAPIPPEVASQARKDELRRYLIAQLNFFHLTTLHRMSTRELKSGPNPFERSEHVYPPGVYELLMNDGVRIGATIKNIHELRRVLPAFERAIRAMREHFMAHPPEETELYKKNLEVIGKDGTNSKFWKVSFHQLSDRQVDEGGPCLGFRPRSMAMVVIPPFYNLVFFQSGNGFKIGSLFCTEPPCVD